MSWGIWGLYTASDQDEDYAWDSYDLPSLWQDYHHWWAGEEGDPEDSKQSIQDWSNVESYLHENHGLPHAGFDKTIRTSVGGEDWDRYYEHPATVAMAKLHSLAQGKNFFDDDPTGENFSDDDVLQGAALGLLKIRRDQHNRIRTENGHYPIHTAAIEADVAEDLRRLAMPSRDAYDYMVMDHKRKTDDIPEQLWGLHEAAQDDDDSWIPRKENGTIDIPKYMELRKARPQKPEPLTKTLYHITDNPDFALDPKRQPTEGLTWASGPRMKNGIYLTDMPSYWKPWGKRPYVVSVEVPTELVRKHRPALGGDPEYSIPAEHFPSLKINKVMSWEGYEQETRHEWARDDPNPWNDDVRNWSQDQRQQYEAQYDKWHRNEYGDDSDETDDHHTASTDGVRYAHIVEADVAEDLRKLGMPSRDAYDYLVMDRKKKTDDIPEEGSFYHGSNHEHQPGDILESVRARGDQDRLDYYEKSVGAPNHADWVWMYNHPAPATKYHKNVYELEPLDEGPWVWNNILRDDGQFRPTENDEDFPRLVSPRARVVRKLSPDEHAAAGQHLSDYYQKLREQRTARFVTAAHEHVESGQPGRPDWTGCAHPECRPDLPSTMYHVSHPKNRDSIAQHGLLTSYSEDDEFSDELGMPHGIYMTSDEPKLSHDTERWPGDVWAVDTTKLKHLENDFPGGMLFRNAFATKYDVPPEAIRLHRPSAHHPAPRTAARIAMPAPLPKGTYFRYHPELVWSPGVTAHAPGGKLVGSLEWYDDDHVMVDLGSRRPGEIDRIQVPEDHRGQSIATSMFDFAKQHEPRLHHSEQLTDDGRGWSEYEKSRTAARLGMAWQDWSDHIERQTEDGYADSSCSGGSCAADNWRHDGRDMRYQITHPDGGWSALDYGHHADSMGQPYLSVNMIRTHPDHQRDGLAEALMRRLVEDHPGVRIDPGDMSQDGQAFHDRMLNKEPSARDVLAARLAMPAPPPEGLHFKHHIEDSTIPKGHNLPPEAPLVTAHIGDDPAPVGYLEWFYDDDYDYGDMDDEDLADHGEVRYIHVNPDWRGSSVASSMFDWTKKNVIPELHHSKQRTDDGNGWVHYMQNRDDHTATRLAMPMQDAYDNNWPDNGDVMDVGSRPDKLPNDIPIFPGPWYHGSDDDFGPGDVLTSQTPDSKVNRRRWTFMTDEPGYAQNYGKNIYEVEPLDEGPYPWNGQTGVAANHYVSPRARVVRKINLDDMAGERGRQKAVNFYLKHYPDLFKKNARVTAGRNGDPPPMTFEPFDTMWTNGIMARHAEDGRPLAHLHWYPDGEIETIRVHPQMRGRGVGKAILTHAATNPETYEAQGGIKPSNHLTADGRAFAQSMGHTPSDEEITPAEGEHEWAWKAVDNYVPLHVPYNGQNEAEMSKYLEQPWTPPAKTASADDEGWPVWWRNRHRPAGPFDKRWHPNHPEHTPAPWQA